MNNERFCILTSACWAACRLVSSWFKRLAASSNPEVAELAAIVIEVAKVKPYKRRRLKVLARQRRDLLDALERTGLIFAHHG